MFGHAAAQELPPGVPNPLNPDGTLSDSFTFTTKASFIAPFGYAYVTKNLGNITSSNYSYGAVRSNRFSELCITRLDERCMEYQERHQLPVAQVDRNAAYRLATQWLAALRVDVKALETDCEPRVQPNEFWNRIKPGGRLEGKTFVPIYDVQWRSAKNKAENFGSVASVQLFTPPETILQISIYDAKYILREPLVVTNLGALLQTNRSAIGTPPTSLRR